MLQYLLTYIDLQEFELRMLLVVLKKCIINNTVATGLYVRGIAKLVKRDSFKI